MLGKKSLSLILVAILAISAAPLVYAQGDGDLGLPLLEAAPEDVQAYYLPDGEQFQGQSLNVVINSTFLETNPEPLEMGKAKFEELTGATINYIPLPENQLYDQVRLELAVESGAYDMVHTGAGGAMDFGLAGFLVPLPEPPDADDFFEADMDQYSAGDAIYGLPMVADTNILYWRTDLFEAAGLDPAAPPQTYDELRDYALKLTTDTNGKHPGEDGFDPNNIEVYGLAFKGIAGLASTWEWYNYLYAFGGDVFDAEYNVTIDSPEAVASLQWVVDNLREYNIYPADTATYDYTEFHTLFIQGRVAMAINWPYMWNMAQDPAQSEIVGQVAIGRKPSQVTHGGEIGGWSWNVFQMSQNQDLAIAFAKFMSGPDISLAFAEGGNVPARKSVAAIMTERDPVLYGAIAENQADGKSIGFIETGPSWTPIEQELSQAIQEALIGDKDPATALKDAKSDIEGILEDNHFYEDILPQLVPAE